MATLGVKKHFEGPLKDYKSYFIDFFLRIIVKTVKEFPSVSENQWRNSYN